MTGRAARKLVALLALAAILGVSAQAFARGHETDNGPAVPTPVIKKLFRRSHHGARILDVTRSPLFLGPTYAGVIYRPKGATGFQRIDLAVYHERGLLAHPTVGQRGLLSPAARWQVAAHGTGSLDIVRTRTYPAEDEEPARTITEEQKGPFEWALSSPGGQVIDPGNQDGGPIDGAGRVQGSGTFTVTSVQEPELDKTCALTIAGEPSNANYQPLSKPGPHGIREQISLGLGDSIETESPPAAGSECSGAGPVELPSNASAAFSVIVPQAPWTSPVGSAIAYHFHTVKKVPDVLAQVSEEITFDLNGTAALTMTGFE
jgi:hypothetical protein